MTDALNNMLTRVSTPKLSEPVPSLQELQTMFKCAIRAPDHGRLKPWRFVVLEKGALRELGDAFAQTLEGGDEIKRGRLRAKPLRAPMIVVVVAKLDPEHNKIPLWEQQVAAGIAAQHIQLAAHHQGFGCMWRTGSITEAPQVRQYLSLAETEQIIGFLYLGTPVGEPRQAEHQDLADIVEYRS